MYVPEQNQQAKYKLMYLTKDKSTIVLLSFTQLYFCTYASNVVYEPLDRLVSQQ